MKSANELFDNLRDLMSHSNSLREDSPELYHNLRFNYYKLLDLGMKNGLLNDFAERYVDQSFMNNYKNNQEARPAGGLSQSMSSLEESLGERTANKSTLP